MPTPGNLLLVGVRGPELTPAEAELYARVQPGGFILFTRNIRTAPQLRKLIDDLRALSRHEPIITIDQEGGRVSRLRQLGAEPPNAQQFRQLGDPALVRRHGELSGKLMRLFGMNLNLCPVLDISFDDEADNSLRGRCYGTTPEQVVELAGTFNDALRAEGIASCGKHFPGYAAATSDPHHGLPAVHRSLAELESAELIPFRRLASRLDSIMTGHTWYPCFDPERMPASLSPRVVENLLRRDLGFTGLVMTDDLDMGALLELYTMEQSLHLALAAGNDLLMICHRLDHLEVAATALDRAPRTHLDRALANVVRFRENLAPPHAFSETAFAALDAEVWNLRVATLGPERAKERSPDIHKRSPVETF